MIPLSENTFGIRYMCGQQTSGRRNRRLGPGGLALPPAKPPPSSDKTARLARLLGNQGLIPEGLRRQLGRDFVHPFLPVRIGVTARERAGKLIVVVSRPHGKAAYALVTHQGQDEVGFARGFIQNLALDGVGVNIGDEARPLFFLFQDGSLD